MIVEVKVPSPGESITEVQVASWLVEDGDFVEKDQDIVEIDSDKATLPLAATEDGKITIVISEGETIDVGTVIAKIDTDVKGSGKKEKPADEKAEKKVQNEPAAIPDSKQVGKPEPETKKDSDKSKSEKSDLDLTVSPLARKLMQQNNVSEKDFIEFFKNHRIGKSDVEYYLKEKDKVHSKNTSQPVTSWKGGRNEDRKKMSMLRKKLAQRLVSVKNETAMLTTFNEVNMSPIMNIRTKYKESFKQQHGIGLGFMSFFTKAITEAIAHFPQINSQLDGDDVVTFDYVDISIAVSAPKGLVVPVIRNAEMLSLDEIEKEIKVLAEKARDNKISIEEMQGGTFTITNGGVFGSMLSTPIINPPQSAILGMHNIVERPIAVNGKVEIHPVMYVALSYDHRIIDGRESVSFLVKVKEMLENPERMLYGGKNGVEVLLGL
jgi:2-oxoglutarate dehydrogenase E2 component (dihydrolipoamide succinyltransferase)